jgi:anti-anti-sigma factor
MTLKISVDLSKTPTVTLVGRLDTDTAPSLDATLNDVLANKKVTHLVFNVAGVDYLSSAGIRCLVRARKAIEPRGGKVVVVNPQPSVRKVLDIVKAIPSGGIFASVAELDAYLDDIQKQMRDRS